MSGPTRQSPSRPFYPFRRDVSARARHAENGGGLGQIGGRSVVEMPESRGMTLVVDALTVPA